MKAGDIVVSRRIAPMSLVIQVITGSRWSHVAIATDSCNVLEAVKVRKFFRRQGDEVREVPLADFLRANGEVVCFVRPESLTVVDVETRLLEFKKTVVGIKNYTWLHAGLTALGRFLWICFSIFLPWVAFDMRGAFPGDHFTYVIFMVAITIFIGVPLAVLTWSFRVKWGVAKVEKFYRRFRLGRYMIAVKYSAFCSRLVLWADDALSGPLSALCPADDEVLPKHIAFACQVLKWDKVPLRL